MSADWLIIMRKGRLLYAATEARKQILTLQLTLAITLLNMLREIPFKKNL